MQSTCLLSKEIIDYVYFPTNPLYQVDDSLNKILHITTLDNYFS